MTMFTFTADAACQIIEQALHEQGHGQVEQTGADRQAHRERDARAVGGQHAAKPPKRGHVLFRLVVHNPCRCGLVLSRE